LDGVVSELPEEIGKLDNLKFLSVPNNKNLKSIPSSVAQIPNLMVINITGSPNVKIPEEIQNKEGLIISK
jgi:Leucine-rich repeat (LRR) protein